MHAVNARSSCQSGSTEDTSGSSENQDRNNAHNAHVYLQAFINVVLHQTVYKAR